MFGHTASSFLQLSVRAWRNPFLILSPFYSLILEGFLPPWEGGVKAQRTSPRERTRGLLVLHTMLFGCILTFNLH